jgi:hypothetical protein
MIFVAAVRGIIMQRICRLQNNNDLFLAALPVWRALSLKVDARVAYILPLSEYSFLYI